MIKLKLRDGRVLRSEWNSKQITVFTVQSQDVHVKFIEAGSNSDKQRKIIRLGDTVIFIWDKSDCGLISNLSVVALDKDNLALYKYKFNPKTPGIIKTSELNWYSANDK